MIHIYALHHNPNEWQQPFSFIPERFDSESPYYLTPKGTKRNPMSFGPFIGGKRICLGKTFAESMLKCLITMIVSNVSFEMVNKDHYSKKPTIGFFEREVEEIKIRVFKS
jgi:cytochrome P450